MLLIGDRAIHSPPGTFAEVWDLGDQWCRWAELPFVFAMWTARRPWPANLGGLEAALSEARTTPRRRESRRNRGGGSGIPLGLTIPQCLSYLRDNLYFYLGPRERRGLELFRGEAVKMGLAPTNSNGQYPGTPVRQAHGMPAVHWA